MRRRRTGVPPGLPPTRPMRPGRVGGGRRTRPSQRHPGMATIPAMGDLDLGLLVKAAAAGDRTAWERLVDRFSGLVWAVTRSYRLGLADADDVFQATWLRLVEHLDRIQAPERLGSWLATTARREALAVLRRSGRYVLADEPALDRPDDLGRAPEHLVVEAERHALLWRALDSLSERCRQLLRLLVADPAPTYLEVSAAIDMPVGSIGPIRGRCLEALRRRLP